MNCSTFQLKGEEATEAKAAGGGMPGPQRTGRNKGERQRSSSTIVPSAYAPVAQPLLLRCGGGLAKFLPKD